MSEGNIIEIENLSFDYVDRKSRFGAIKDVNLEVKKGEFICVLGSSGCGKSTLLKLLAGLLKPAKGSIRVNGSTVNGPGVDRAVVFQHYSLFPWLDVRSNVIFGIRQGNGKHTRKEEKKLAAEYLEAVGLLEVAGKYPAQLSGGQQQRVAVARALALESEILLMDEPFGAIDPRLRLELQELVGRLSTEKKKTVVFITHDIDEAILLADRIIVMEPGRIKLSVDINLDRPRKREELVGTEEYKELYKKLTVSFYDGFAGAIEGEVRL